MPGYGMLEQFLKVSRPTMEKTFAELTVEGLLSEAEAGKSRKILASPSPLIPYAETRALLVLGSQPVSALNWPYFSSGFRTSPPMRASDVRRGIPAPCGDFGCLLDFSFPSP